MLYNTRFGRLAISIFLIIVFICFAFSPTRSIIPVLQSGKQEAIPSSGNEASQPEHQPEEPIQPTENHEPTSILPDEPTSTLSDEPTSILPEEFVMPTEQPSIQESNLLPTEYLQEMKQPAFCRERYGLEYLENLSQNHYSYCKDDSKSQFTCFYSQTNENGRTDSFCIGGSVGLEVVEASEVVAEDGKKLALDCDRADKSPDRPLLKNLPFYWDNTGPGPIFQNYFQPLEKQMASPLNNLEETRNFSILVKREEGVTNTWHNLMQIFSQYLTLDVLRMTINPITKRPYLTLEDAANTQLIILDDYEEGPYFELWKYFAQKPIVHWQNVSEETMRGDQVIIPLAGPSNTLWEGDWKVFACQESPLVRTFATRVLSLYGIDTSESRADDSRLVLTYIDRKGKRRLQDQERYLEDLKQRYPLVEINVVDFAEMSLEEQLKLTWRTDILVGVHGAGLTNGLFMQPGSTMVEILPPDLEHKGFRNMANLCSHLYFSSHASASEQRFEKADWHDDDISISEDSFLELVGTAIKSMSNKRLLNQDVS